MPQITIYNLEQNLANVGQELTNLNNEIAEKAGNPTVEDKDIYDMQEKADSMEKRYNILQKQLEKRKNQAKQKTPGFKKTEDPKKQRTSAYAQLIRSTMSGGHPSTDVLAALGDDGTDKTGGQNLLPVTVANEIISEPFETNPLREDEVLTGITNLSIPRLRVTIDDDDFVQDQEVSKELKLKGDTVQFERNKVKIKVPVSEAILNGSDLDLTSYINSSLQSGLASKEKKVAFTTTPKAGEEHMSFYSDVTGIKKVSGSTAFDAITQAAADISDGFQEKVVVYMTRPGYLSMIKELANGSTTLYGKQPEEVLGYPVKFTELATQPVVGNFTYAQLNYEITSTLYEQWKDFDKGINYFGLTAWFDHQILLASAFRIANVTAGK